MISLMQKTNLYNAVGTLFIMIIISTFISTSQTMLNLKYSNTPKAVLIPTEKFYFNSFVDCNMAEAWIGDTFRIFPGKYGEDPLWGYARDLKFADGRNADEAFSSKAETFTEPIMPKNAKPGTEGLHGAVWFETVYQDTKDKTGKTLFAVYHNENYPSTLPYDSSTGKGYIDANWPRGLTGPTTPAAVCRIGIMKSVDGGRSWSNKGIFIEDNQPRMILKPHNTSVTFAGGTGDPSAVASGDYLYLFYGEYGYPGKGKNSQEWSSIPELLIDKPGHILWYPSLQPVNSAADIANKNTCLKLGQQARLFFKDQHDSTGEYLSEYIVKFEKQQ